MRKGDPENMTEEDKPNTMNSLDSILVRLGEFGKYQSIMFGLVCVGVILHSGVHVAFVFTAMDVEYRCLIPECESSNAPYDQPWLPNAVPFTSEKPSKCLKFLINNDTEFFGNCTKISDFTSSMKRCHSFVYKTEEKSILQEYDLQCDENLWKLTLVGTINNVGQFFGLFISGFISDKFGRKLVLIWGLIFCGICGLARTTAPTYLWYLTLEFLDAAFGAGSYICGFIMGVELVGPKKRVLTGTLISSCYTLGEVIAAGSAWYFKNWRPVIYVLYAPPMLLFFYIWVLPESIRWYLSKGKLKEAKEILRNVAKVNGRKITEQELDTIESITENEANKSALDVLKSRTLLLRLLNCLFSWITCAFLFYGLTLNSVALAGNSYLDFILTALVEIPAYFICIYIVDKIGRRWSLSGSYFITAISCLVFLFLHQDYRNARLAMWMIGKFGSTIAFTVIYIITSELFPTPLRHSMMGSCSTFGRVGSMVAPQTPLLAQLWKPLPVLSFAVLAVVAGFLTLLFPETLNIKLPDTIEESVNIGKNKNASDKNKICDASS